MTYRTPLAVVAAGLLLAHAAAGADWITAPSYYTHDPSTGERVTQYSPIGPFYTYARPDFLRSGYRHTRSSIQAGNSADHLHVVEEWGRPVRPYGEWRFPYRPYSVPYAAWGPPFAGTGVSWLLGLPARVSRPYSEPYAEPYAAPGVEGQPYGRQQPPPYYDGSYPDYRTRPRRPGDRCNSPVGRDARIRGIPRTDPIAPILAGEVSPAPGVTPPPRTGGGSA